MALLIEVWIQKRCLIAGHSATWGYGQWEVFARCDRCGRRSPGWQLPATRPVLRFEGDPARHVLVTDESLEAIFGIPDGDPSPFRDDQTPAMLLPMGGRLQVVSEADARLLLMRTRGVH